MLHWFVKFNRTLSWLVSPQSLADHDIANEYTRLGALLMSQPNVSRVVDVGAGKVWHFPLHYKKWYGIKLIGVDIDGEEMADNTLLDEKFVADVVENIPVDPESVDLIMVRSGVEHFSDNQRFLDNAYAALRPGGFLIAFFPNRYAPFAIINRMLPQRVSKRVLQETAHETADELGFKVFYDRTNYTGFRRLYAKAGFKAVYHLPSFYSCFYFRFFLPLFFLSYFFDTMRFMIGSPRLAAYHIWVLQKPGPVEEALQLYTFYGPP